jgi:hypothetical protein
MNRRILRQSDRLTLNLSESFAPRVRHEDGPPKSPRQPISAGLRLYFGWRERLLTGHTDERSFRRYVVAVEQEAAIAAYYRLKAEGQTEAVVYAKNLSREQRRLLIAMAELAQMQPMYQDDLENGEISFAQLWQENIIHLERIVADVWELPKKLGVAV